MKNLKYIFIVAFLAIFSLTSCEKKETDPASSTKNLSGKWVVTSVDPASAAVDKSFTFIFENTQYTIASASGTTTESGNFSFDGKNLTFEGSSTFPKPCKVIGEISKTFNFSGDLNLSADKPSMNVSVNLEKQD